MAVPEDEKPLEEIQEVTIEVIGEEEVGGGLLDEDSVPKLQTELEIALEEASKLRDQLLRSEAEMQNVRRRAERDVENAHKFGLERFVQNLLPVVDSLEKAIEAAEQAEDATTPANKAIIEGIGLCQKLLMDVLGKESVLPVDPQGEPFDPKLHQAISVIENPDVEPNSVVIVVQKGYTMSDRLARPALVVVSKPAGQASGK